MKQKTRAKVAHALARNASKQHHNKNSLLSSPQSCSHTHKHVAHTDHTERMRSTHYKSTYPSVAVRSLVLFAAATASPATRKFVCRTSGRSTSSSAVALLPKNQDRIVECFVATPKNDFVRWFQYCGYAIRLSPCATLTPLLCVAVQEGGPKGHSSPFVQ
jgi:hypothetical protein